MSRFLLCLVVVAADAADLTRPGHARKPRRGAGHSQGGQSERLEALFKVVGPGNYTFVEFGYQGVHTSNTAKLRVDHGWTGLLLDGREHKDYNAEELNLHVAFITSANIVDTLKSHGALGHRARAPPAAVAVSCTEWLCAVPLQALGPASLTSPSTSTRTISGCSTRSSGRTSTRGCSPSNTTPTYRRPSRSASPTRCR